MTDATATMSLTEDKALLRQWCRGDKAAGDRLIRYQFEWVSTAVLRWVHGDTNTASDIVQATFEVALHNKAQIRGGFGPYVRGVARLKVLEHFRDRNTLVEELTASMRSDAQGAESAILDVEQQRLAVKALRQLSVEQQALMYLRYVQGMKLREIAQAQGVSIGTIDGQLRRAEARLSRDIERLAESPDLGQSTLMEMSSWLRRREDDASTRAADEPD